MQKWAGMVLAEMRALAEWRLQKSFPLEPPSRMHLIRILALVCLVGFVAAQDPCAFAADSSYPTVWIQSRANVLNCFNSIAFNSARRDTLVTILNSTWNAYSFHDYLSEPIAPYNLQVRRWL